MKRSFSTLVAACLLALPAAASADGTVLEASTGPGDAITLANPDGTAVTHLEPGTYTIRVSDTSDRRDFTLRGPGVSEHSGFEAVGSHTWTVTFTDGWYRFYDAALEDRFNGRFSVGTPPATTLKANVTNTAISFTKSDGSPVKQLDPGTYSIAVRDTSVSNNFHFMGPGVDEHTQVFPLADYTWTVTFGAGRYSFFSERHVNLHGSFTVGTAPASSARVLHGVAGPDFSIALVDANWQPLTKKLARGSWTISIQDQSADHDFRLRGPNINRSTPLEFVGTATWKITLAAGFYLFRCDPHDIMFGGFEVAKPPAKKKKKT
jgi:hypothetical protein